MAIAKEEEVTMALYIPIQITRQTANGMVVDTIETVEIKRLEPLDNPEDARDEIHTYRVRGQDGTEGKFKHRYGDGAVACASLGLTVLNALRMIDQNR